MPKAGDWNFATEPVPDPADGQLLVKMLQLSLDPAMRGWMNEGRSYIPPVSIGEVSGARASANAYFAPRSALQLRGSVISFVVRRV